MLLVLVAQVSGNVAESYAARGHECLEDLRYFYKASNKQPAPSRWDLQDLRRADDWFARSLRLLPKGMSALLGKANVELIEAHLFRRADQKRHLERSLRWYEKAYGVRRSREVAQSILGVRQELEGLGSRRPESSAHRRPSGQERS